MAHRRIAQDDEISDAIADLPGWRRDGDALVADYRSADFSAALGFIVRIGIIAEKLDHHPDLFNVYNKVTLRFSTHDADNKITDLDLEAAGASAAIADELGLKPA